MNRYAHADGKLFQPGQQMLAILNAVVALIREAEAIVLIEFDVVDDEVRDVFQVSIFLTFVVSGVHGHRIQFKRLCDLQSA